VNLTDYHILSAMSTSTRSSFKVFKATRAPLPLRCYMPSWPAFLVIYARDYIGVTPLNSPSKDDMLSLMADLLGTENHVLAVFDAGRPLAFDEIERLKRDAIDLLMPGTILRAKAEGRFYK